jgi:hypothetical protein
MEILVNLFEKIRAEYEDIVSASGEAVVDDEIEDAPGGPEPKQGLGLVIGERT